MTALSGPIVFNNTDANASDSAASGCGPATAITVMMQFNSGTNTATASWSGTISQGDLIYVPANTAGRRFNVVASVGTGSLVFDDNWGDTQSTTAGYVGGKRAGGNLTTDSIWGDAPSGAVIEIEYTGTNYQLNGTWYPERTTVTDTIKIKGTGSSKPVIEGGAFNTQHIRVNNGIWSFENLEFLFTRTTSGSMIDLDYGAAAYASLYNCKFSKSNTSVGGQYIQKARPLASKVVECVFDGNSGAMGVGYTCLSRAYISTSLHNCVFHGFSQAAVDMNRGQEGVIEGCVFYDCSKAIDYTGNSYIGGDTIKGNIFYDISGNAISYVNGNNTIHQSVIGNVFCTIGGNAISAASVYGQSNSSVFDRNAFYGITGSNYNNLTAGANDITLTADPFVDAANGDFNISDSAGGGATLRSTNYTIGG